MIVDRLEHADLYGGLAPRIVAALQWLRTTDLEALPAGKVTIDGEHLFAVVQEYQTKPREEGFWEAHRRYIDVQYVVHGHELMGYAPLRSLHVTQPYDPEKEMLKAAGPGDFIGNPAGTVFILWPHDAHMPGIAEGAPVGVKKIVVKVEVGG